MIILIVGILLILYGELSGRKYSTYRAMLFVLLIMGFQDGVQGDFMSYRDSFYLSEGIGYTTKETEYSFIWVNHFFQFTTFSVYVFCMALTQCLILAYVLKVYVHPRFQNFGWLVFFFTTGCMLIQMKAMRQGFAIEWMLFSFILLDKRRWVLSLIALAIGWGFHNSAMIFLPIYLLLVVTQASGNQLIQNFSPLRKINIFFDSKVFPITVSFGCILFYGLKKMVLDSYLIPYATTMDLAYEGYVDAIEITGVAWWILCFLCIFAYLVADMIRCNKNNTVRIIGFATIISIYGMIAVWGLGNMMRIVYYYTIFDIITYPMVAEHLSKKYKNKYSIYFIIFYMLYALKFSLPWMLNTHDDMFGTYKFVFMS